MNRYLNFVLLLCLVVAASEAKPARGRCRKSTPTKCVPKRLRHPAFPEPEERLRVTWSSDGLVGNRYFEQDGRHYVEIQELFPIGNGRYRIRSRTEETTAPPRGVVYPAPEFPQEPIGAGSNNFEQPRSWMEELADVPAWPVTKPDQNVQEMTPQEIIQPGAASQQSPPEAQIREDIKEQARVIEPAQPRTKATENEERIAADVHQQPRDMTREEAYARVEPIATPREEHEGPYGGYYYYYDEIWYEPANQRHYPRLLFSPRFGWREMTEEEILRIRNIRPISEFDPALAITSNPYPAQQYHRQEDYPQRERYPSQTGEYEQPVQQSSSNAHVSAYRYNAGAHTRPLPEGNEEVPSQNRVQDPRGTWIFQRGNWQFEPHGSVEVGPEVTPETASPVYNSGNWIFTDGAWHYRSPSSTTEKPEQSVMENPPEKMVGIPAVKVNESKAAAAKVNGSVASPKKIMVKVRKFHAPDNLVKENQENLREFVAKAVQIDHGTEKNRNNQADDKDYGKEHDLSQKDQKEDGSQKIPEIKIDSASANDSGQLPQIAGDSSHYLQKGNLAAVVYTEKDKNENQEKKEKEEEKKKQEDDKETKSQQGGSYFIKEGNIGAYIYSEDNGNTENSSKDSDKSSQDESSLSPDEFKRLIPSEHTISRLQLKDHSGIKPCNAESADSAGGDFWLLRTRPCDENSREGRIILPNGEVLKFYGQPQLVYV